MYQKHGGIIKLILILFIASVLLNFFINAHLVVLSGEFPFSFQYPAHVWNIVINYLLKPKEAVSLLDCKTCPNFYGLTPWNAIWMLALVSPGTLLHLHPVIYYTFITVSVQLIFLYLFLRAFFKEFSWPVFLIASSVFIFFPHKFYLVPSYTMDGVIYGIFLGQITAVTYLLSRLDTLSFSKIMLLSIAAGFLSALFLNIALGHLPVFVYAFLLNCLLFIPNIIRNVAKSLTFFGTIALLCLLINLPFVLSYVHSTTDEFHYLNTYNPVSMKDSLSAGATLAGANPVKSVLFLLIALGLLLVANIHMKKKLLLIVGYLLIAFLLTGGQIGQFRLYSFAFDHLPFLNHLRSLYRLFFFQTLIIFLAVYLGLLTVWRNRHVLSKPLVFLLSIFFLYYFAGYAYRNIDIFHWGVIPQDYFAADAYLSQNFAQKMYFPAFGPVGKDFLSGNYTWLSAWPVRNSSIFANPYTSLFFLPNMIFTEGYQLDTPEEGQLRSLINYQQPPKETIDFLSYLGIKYVLVDRNYLWDKNFPRFAVNAVGKYATLEKQFGNIAIYSLQNKQKQCKPSYGDFAVGYCYTPDNPLYLVNRTAQDYVLDGFVRAKSPYLLPRNTEVKIGDNIVNTDVRAQVIKEKILIPFTVYQADNDVTGIFIKHLTKGSYRLFFPMLTLSAADKQFYNSHIDITLNGKLIKTFVPYSVYHGMQWKVADLSMETNAVLSINAHGYGLSVFGNPLLIPTADLPQLEKHIDTYKHLKIVHTQGGSPDVPLVAGNNHRAGGGAVVGAGVNVTSLPFTTE